MLEKQDNKMVSHIAAERAIDELRRQMGIILQTYNQKYLALYPVEFMDTGLHKALTALDNNAKMLLTGSRARHLSIIHDPAIHDILLPAGTVSLAQIETIANPLSQQPLPAGLVAEEASKTHMLALKLAKYASLLPALFCIEVNPDELPAPLKHWHHLHATDIESYVAHPLLDIIETAHANLPTAIAENTRILSFRARFGTAVHLAMVTGDIHSVEHPLTRVHSSCVTGDILGSLRCDCGDQLKLAMQQIADEGQGILLYLHQEGRGIGITNKLRAYQLQEQGFDTYDANLLLGFEEDERDFSVASAILKALGVQSIRLLTNNPHKLDAIEKAGIRVSQRVALITSSGKHNHAYLDAKAKKSGHMLKP